MDKLRKTILFILYILVGSSLLYLSTKMDKDEFGEKLISAIGEAFLVLGFVEVALQPYITSLINKPTSFEKLKNRVDSNLRNVDSLLDTTRKTFSNLEEEYKELERQMLADKIEFISQDLETTKQYILEIRDAIINKNSDYKDNSASM